MNSGSDSSDIPVKSIKSTFCIIEILHKEAEQSVTNIANQTDLALSTVHNHLCSLECLGLVVQSSDKKYQLSAKFLDLGATVRADKIDDNTVRSVLSELSIQTGEGVWFLIEENGVGVNLYKSLGENAVQTYGRIGEQRPLHGTAAGKAILASLSDRKIREILDERGLPKYTNKTITDEDKLFESINTIRNQGVAFSDEEIITGVRSVGVPVTIEERTVGGMSIGGPAYRMEGEYFTQELPKLLLKYANELELKLIYD